MWLLVIVLLAAPEGIQPRTAIEAYDTYEECKAWRDYVGYWMADAYPHEADFRIECVLRGKGQA